MFDVRVFPDKSRSSHQRCSVKKGVLRNFAKFIRKHLCQSISFNEIAGLKVCNFIKREILAQVFSSEFCEISKNTFLTEHLWATASINLWTDWYWYPLSSHFFDCNAWNRYSCRDKPFQTLSNIYDYDFLRK